MKTPTRRGAISRGMVTCRAAAVAVFLALVIPLSAQIPSPPPNPGTPIRSAAELDTMLAPIALYPDPLIAQILPAATLPDEVVLADRFLRDGGDPGVIDQQAWDPSVRAMARYPAVLKMMDDYLGWTTQLGQAFLAQPDDVMNSVQRLRAEALQLGNLRSSPQQSVVNDDGVIEILPADPGTLYVPAYQPSVIFTEPCPAGFSYLTFGVGFPIGLWLNHDCDWRHHALIVWHRDHPRPRDWWSRRPAERNRPTIVGDRVTVPNHLTENATVWRPRNRAGVAVAAGRDRGWAGRDVIHSQPAAPRPERAPERPAGRGPEPAPVRPNPNPPIRSTTPSRPEPPPQFHPATRGGVANGAVIGVGNARDTRDFSARGQLSRQAPSRPAAPAQRSAPPAASHSAAPAPSRSSGSGSSGSKKP